MKDEQIIALMEGYGAGTLSEEDAITFFQWYSEAGQEEFHRIYAQCKGLPGDLPAYPQMPDNFRTQLEQAIRDHEANELQNADTPARLIPLFRRYRLRWAAAILLVMGVVGYLIYQSRQSAPAGFVQHNDPSFNDVAPGTTKAVLTLSDGRQVIIDSSQSGQLAVQGKMTVEHDHGAIVYNGNAQIETKKNTQPTLYNTLTTGRGEQSPPLTLSDGTKVWLNAFSSIRFPVAFTGNERIVEITGEAYFEVASVPLSDSHRDTDGVGKGKLPFRVYFSSLNGGDRKGAVEVLGTHFNVNAYDDEEAIKTTLLEGKVRVTPVVSSQLVTQRSQVLFPGQQARINQRDPDQIQVISDVDLDLAIAWKKGLFDFNHASLQTVLRQLSRWYDIEVKFEGDAPVRTFRGKITRDLSLSQVIQVLQDIDVKFRIEGKTLIVTK